jgi:cytoskeletal protein CcmA (bactofilin family)
MMTTGQSSRAATISDFGGDRFASGSSLEIQRPVSGDLFAAGGSVSIATEVRGDAVTAGRDVRIQGPVREGDVYAAGGRVVVNSEIEHNVRAAGGSVELGPQASVQGNVTLAGGSIQVNGPVHGYIQANGGRVYLNGPVDGDARVMARTVELGPAARINGKLIYSSRTEVKRDAGAQTNGGVERLPGAGGWRGTGIWTFYVIGMLGLMLLAAVLIALLPGTFRRISGDVAARPWFDIGVGLLALVCIPVLIVLLLISFVGVPLALLLASSYLVLLMTGYVTGGIAIGEITLDRFEPSHSAQRSWQIAAGLIGVLVLLLLSRIPFLGGIIAFLSLLIGVGAIMRQLRRMRTMAPASHAD